VARGSLRIYLGAAPGVGKTFAMLDEGNRRRVRGTDVVIAYVETHLRPRTVAAVGDLEVIPRRAVEYRGAAFEEMDVDAVLARQPDVALVDELAHSNVPGSRHEKRWQDVEDLLAAGIDVISTVNVQHLESLNDVVEEIAGVKQLETVPDAVVRAADQIELVDMTPEALRRRMAHGNIYKPDKVDAALANYFRVGNLGALRELALLWVADRTEEALQEYRSQNNISQVWETRDRVVVALTGAPSGAALVRRAGRMAMRLRGDLIGVHVRTSDGLAAPPSDDLVAQRRLLDQLGGIYREISGTDVARALGEFVTSESATQLVIGASRQSRWAELTRGSTVARLVRSVNNIDVHVVATEPDPEVESRPVMPRVRRRRLLPARRMLVAFVVAVVAPILLTVVLSALGDAVKLPAILLLYLALVVATGAIGGFLPAAAAAIIGSLLANWYFTPPVHTFTIQDRENVLALIIFLFVGGVVGALVSTTARRTSEAARARAEAETLAALGGALVGSEDPMPVIVDQLKAAFDARGVAVMHRVDNGWVVDASAGAAAASWTSPDDASVRFDLSEDLVLVLDADDLPADDLDVLQSFTDTLLLALERRELRAVAAAATGLQEANALRTALLAAVSHDLRTPLSSIKASATSLLQRDVDWSEEATREFLETIDEESDRLNALVGNLLDMSRLQTGAVQLVLKAVGVEEVVLAATHGMRGQLDIDVSESLPRVNTDAALLERVLANLIENALAWSPPDTPVRIVAGLVEDRLEVRIVDRGPGIPVAQRSRIFEPFQRLGDRSNGTGVGLGLAVARGLVGVIHGTLTIEDTPGGGTTFVVGLPVEPKGVKG
jgi:two-component system sensor histidine kinase KdpD